MTANTGRVKDDLTELRTWSVSEFDFGAPNIRLRHTALAVGYRGIGAVCDCDCDAAGGKDVMGERFVSYPSDRRYD